MVAPFAPPLLRAALVRAARASWRIARAAPALLDDLGLVASCHEQIEVWIRGDLSEKDAAIEVRLLAARAEEALALHLENARAHRHALPRIAVAKPGAAEDEPVGRPARDDVGVT
jgi:hypothetical protein